MTIGHYVKLAMEVTGQLLDLIFATHLKIILSFMAYLLPLC